MIPCEENDNVVSVTFMRFLLWYINFNHELNWIGLNWIALKQICVIQHRYRSFQNVANLGWVMPIKMLVIWIFWSKTTMLAYLHKENTILSASLTEFSNRTRSDVYHLTKKYISKFSKKNLEKLPPFCLKEYICIIIHDFYSLEKGA